MLSISRAGEKYKRCWTLASPQCDSRDLHVVSLACRRGHPPGCCRNNGGGKAAERAASLAVTPPFEAAPPRSRRCGRREHYLFSDVDQGFLVQQHVAALAL